MLTALINPQWIPDAPKNRDRDFADIYTEWKRDLVQYEMQRKRPLEEDVKIATVTMHAPPDVKTALRQSAHVYGSSFAKMEAILESYLKTGKSYDARGVAVQDRTSGGGNGSSGGSSPMEIGAVQHQP